MTRQTTLRAIIAALSVFLAVVGLVSVIAGLVGNDYSRFASVGAWLAIALIIAIDVLNVACWIVLPAISAYLALRGWPGVRIVLSISAVLYLITAAGGGLWNIITLAASLGAVVIAWLPVTGLQRRASSAT
jgi:hypothetical protein